MCHAMKSPPLAVVSVAGGPVRGIGQGGDMSSEPLGGLSEVTSWRLR